MKAIRFVLILMACFGGFAGSAASRILPAAKGVFPRVSMDASLRAGKSPRLPNAVLNDGATIRVLVVYTQAARTDAGGESQIQALIHKAVGDLNQSFINSQVPAQVVLASTAEVVYVEKEDMGAVLNVLENPTDGFLDEVHTWRSESFADLVSLVVS